VQRSDRRGGKLLGGDVSLKCTTQWKTRPRGDSGRDPSGGVD